VTAADIRAWRARLHITQAAAAELLGINRATLNRYETGKQAVPVAIALACAELARRAGDAA
jgi:DNA-binding XRE family transcriptional regulator